MNAVYEASRRGRVAHPFALFGEFVAAHADQCEQSRRQGARRSGRREQACGAHGLRIRIVECIRRRRRRRRRHSTRHARETANGTTPVPTLYTATPKPAAILGASPIRATTGPIHNAAWSPAGRYAAHASAPTEDARQRGLRTTQAARFLR